MVSSISITYLYISSLTLTLFLLFCNSIQLIGSDLIDDKSYPFFNMLTFSFSFKSDKEYEIINLSSCESGRLLVPDESMGF